MLPTKYVTLVLIHFPTKDSAWVQDQFARALANTDIEVLDDAAIEAILAAEFGLNFD